MARVVPVDRRRCAARLGERRAHLHRHLQGGDGARRAGGRRDRGERHLGRPAWIPAILRVAADAGAAVVLGHLRGAASHDDGRDRLHRRGRRGGRRAGGSGSPRRAPPAASEIWADPGHRLRQAGRAQPGAAARRCRRWWRGPGVPLLVGVSRKSFIGPDHGQAGQRAALRDRRRRRGRRAGGGRGGARPRCRARCATWSGSRSCASKNA